MTTNHNTIITHTHIYISKLIEPYVHSVVKPTRSHNQTNTHIIVVQVEMSKRGVTPFACTLYHSPPLNHHHKRVSHSTAWEQ